jgi:ABC-type phosphate transport system permease subunit
VPSEAFAPLSARNAAGRQIVSAVAITSCVIAAAVILLPLALIVWHLAAKGLPALTLGFFVHNPKPVGEAGGGMANAIVGTLILVLLGAPQWRVLLSVVVPAAWGGILTAIMLAVARAAGETAPLLFTALGNRFWSLSLDQPIASLPVFIFDYARAPYDDWNRQAWTGALVLLMLVATVSGLMRLTTRRIARR